MVNHVAIIGVTGIGITDVVTTPVAARMEGVEVQAQAIENILDGTRLVRPLLAPWLELGLFLSVAAVLMALVPRLGPGFGVAILLIAASALITGSLISFIHWKMLLDPSFPVVGNAAILGVLVTVAFAAVAEKRRELQAELEAARLERGPQGRRAQGRTSHSDGHRACSWSYCGSSRQYRISCAAGAC